MASRPSAPLPSLGNRLVHLSHTLHSIISMTSLVLQDPGGRPGRHVQRIQHPLEKASGLRRRTGDLHQLDNPNRTSSGSDARLPSYAPCQIVPSPPPPPPHPPPAHLRGLYIGGLGPEHHSYLQTLQPWLRGGVEPLQRRRSCLSSWFVSTEETAAGCPLGRVSAAALGAETFTFHLLTQQFHVC